MNVIYYVASSIDGFIARKNGQVDWLDKFTAMGEDYGYDEFYSKIDSLIMGSNTFREIINFDIGWPYEGKPAYVVSRESLDSENMDVTSIPHDLVSVMKTISENNHKNTWLVGGGKLAASMMELGFINEIILFIMPVTIGGGTRLFIDSKELDANFSLVKTNSFNSGVVELHYKRKS